MEADVNVDTSTLDELDFKPQCQVVQITYDMITKELLSQSEPDGNDAVVFVEWVNGRGQDRAKFACLGCFNTIMNNEFTKVIRFTSV